MIEFNKTTKTNILKKYLSKKKKQQNTKKLDKKRKIDENKTNLKGFNLKIYAYFHWKHLDGLLSAPINGLQNLQILLTESFFRLVAAFYFFLRNGSKTFFDFSIKLS